MDQQYSKEAEELFGNRKAFLRFNQFKIDRTLKTLAEKDRLIFCVVPRLLHVHQEGLPGYFESETPVPCGIHNFTVDYASKIAAEKLFPDAIIRRPENLNPIIHSVLLMGSVGSIAMTKKSDLDYTLLVDKSSFTPETLQLFQKKLNLIEQWTWNTYHLETHFFINDHNDVKNNIFGESDSESTGSALAILLKEEMFRTLIVVTGKIPFWWVVPLGANDENYDNLWHMIQMGNTLLKKEEFINMGNVYDISDGEFFGGSIWALIKSFKSPFKTLMKMGLLEEYMFTETASNLLCHEVKNLVFRNETPFLDIDAYLLLFKRVQKFFMDSKTDNEVDALRSSFYLKIGTKVTADDFESAPENWKKDLIVKMMKAWEWTPFKVQQLNEYSEWQMMQKVALGQRVNKILMESYKNISEKNKTLDPSESLITEKDTHLLGRKLFSFFRKAPNKVENLTAIVDGKTWEKDLTFLCDQQGAQAKLTWYLIRGRTLAFVEHVPKENIIKNTNSFSALIAFTAFNNLYRPGETTLLLRAEGQSIRDEDLKNLLAQMSEFIDAVNIAAISNDELMAPARVKQLFLTVDFGAPLPREVEAGNIRNCKTNAELSQYINRQLEMIRNLTATYMTSWGELFCKAYAGANCVGRMFNEMGPQVLTESLDDPNFIKIFIQSGRKEPFKLPWLNNYITRSFKVKGTAIEEKVAS